MTGKISGVLRAAGVAGCLLCAVYMLYVAGAWKAMAGLEASGARTLTIAGIAAVAEGEVVRAENGRTVIRYYHEWDGAEYRRVIAGENGDYPENAVVPVVYTVGMGAGSCLVAGFYRRFMQILGMAGTISLLLGITLSFGRKEREKNGKKKNYSGQLENEYDPQ